VSSDTGINGSQGQLNHVAQPVLQPYAKNKNNRQLIEPKAKIICHRKIAKQVAISSFST
jgi:hypothetical protein